MKPKIIILKNKRLAFERFYNAIKFQNKYPSQLNGFEIPEKLLTKAESLINIRLSRFSKVQKNIYREIRKTFDLLWNKNRKKLEEITRRLKNYERTLTRVAVSIERVTGTKWPYREIFIFPGIRNWASAKENKVCIGIKPEFLIPGEKNFISNTLMSLIIHELIHINTSKFTVREKLFFERDSKEIVTTLLTRKITRNDNKNVPDQKLAKPFENLEKYNESLELLARKNKEYRSLVVAIDSFLKKIGHLKYYIN